MQYNKNIILQFYIKCGIITFEDAMSLSEDKLMNKILKQVHPYSIFQSEYDKKWHTTIADITKVSGRRQIARKKKSDLEKFLLNHYHLQLNIDKSSQKTFKEIFELVQERKLKYVKDAEKIHSKKNTDERTRRAYKRYFADTDFENKPIDEITVDDIDNICLYNLQRYDLKSKAFALLRSILKSVFDLAYTKYWITDNIYQRIDFMLYNDMLVADTPVEIRVHSKQEVSDILRELHKKQADNPKLSSAWALELQIIMGLRRGEVPPLEWSDVTDTYILIHKEQITNGNDFYIVSHTKTSKDSHFPLTNDLKHFLRRLKEMQDIYYPNSKYLFPADNTANGVITNRAVYYVYQRICEKLDIKISADTVKGPHSFRRNAVDDIVNETNGNIIMASALIGNSPQVAKKNYFTGINMETATEVLNKRQLLQ